MELMILNPADIPCSTTSILSGAGLTLATAGWTTTFALTARDAYGNLVNTSAFLLQAASQSPALLYSQSGSNPVIFSSTAPSYPFTAYNVTLLAGMRASLTSTALNAHGIISSSLLLPSTNFLVVLNVTNTICPLP